MGIPGLLHTNHVFPFLPPHLPLLLLFGFFFFLNVCKCLYFKLNLDYTFLFLGCSLLLKQFTLWVYSVGRLWASMKLLFPVFQNIYISSPGLTLASSRVHNPLIFFFKMCRRLDFINRSSQKITLSSAHGRTTAYWTTFHYRWACVIACL